MTITIIVIATASKIPMTIPAICPSDKPITLKAQVKIHKILFFLFSQLANNNIAIYICTISYNELISVVFLIYVCT